MNKKMIRFILGYVMLIEAALMLLPLIVGMIYREQDSLWFLIVLSCAAALGYLLCRTKPEDTVFYLKEGCIATGLSWIVMSILGALPFTLSGAIPSYVDALFETVSGFTTTGASILEDVEALSHSMLFWRSFTHWIGGMGILVFLLAIISMTGGSHMNLMRAESPGPSVGKLVPKVRRTAMILYLIYTGLTFIMVVFLLCGGMSLFESFTTAFGAAGTGGFGIKGDSIAGYSPYIQWVVAIFMLIFGVNFNFYYFLLMRKIRQAVGMEEVRWYFFIVLGAVAVITANIYDPVHGFSASVRDAAFQVSSIITTTGYATADFDTWPQLSRTILVVLMFIGACAGSTGGGIKVSRILIAAKSAIVELHLYIHPKSVRKSRLEGKLLDADTVRSVYSYIFLFIIVFALSVLLISLDGFDLTTNFTAIAATLNNIGPGLNAVGPVKNYAHFSDFSKFVMMFDMLAGRLELFPMLLLLHPAIWREALSRNLKSKKQKSRTEN